jgi:hypothetical protein
MSLVDKIKAAADRIDPRVEGIAILIVGDVQIELGITETGDSEFDARRLAAALAQAVRQRDVGASAGVAGPPEGPVGDDAGSPYLSQLFR